MRRKLRYYKVVKFLDSRDNRAFRVLENERITRKHVEI